MASVPETPDFRQLYQSLGLMRPDGTCLTLHHSCQCCSTCWKDAESRYPPDEAQWSYISRPWIGPRYGELRATAVGINMNGSGGFDEAVSLVQVARREMLKGTRRVDFGAAGYSIASAVTWPPLQRLRG
jgi:hypothetical protein